MRTQQQNLFSVKSQKARGPSPQRFQPTSTSPIGTQKTISWNTWPPWAVGQRRGPSIYNTRGLWICGGNTWHGRVRGVPQDSSQQVIRHFGGVGIGVGRDGVIEFRKCSQHAQCTVCSEYSQFIHYSRASPEDKQAAAKRWYTHLKDQYRDRLIYWNMRCLLPEARAQCPLHNHWQHGQGQGNMAPTHFSEEQGIG